MELNVIATPLKVNRLGLKLSKYLLPRYDNNADHQIMGSVQQIQDEAGFAEHTEDFERALMELRQIGHIVTKRERGALVIRMVFGENSIDDLLAALNSKKQGT